MYKQAFINCMHGYDRVRNVHAIGVTYTQKFVYGVGSSLYQKLESANLLDKSSDVNRSKSGLVRFKNFWAHELE